MNRLHILPLLFFLLFQLNANGQTAPIINVIVGKNILIINNITFTKNSSIADYEKLLGKAERIEKIAGNGKIFLYDKLGISFSLKMNTDTVQDVCITYVYNRDKRVPKEQFKGQLSINGKRIDNKTTADEISKLANIALVMSTKGLHMGICKSLILEVYYTESTIGQFVVSFHDY